MRSFCCSLRQERSHPSASIDIWWKHEPSLVSDSISSWAASVRCSSSVSYLQRLAIEYFFTYFLIISQRTNLQTVLASQSASTLEWWRVQSDLGEWRAYQVACAHGTALCPKTVILWGSPPNWDILSWTHCNAFYLVEKAIIAWNMLWHFHSTVQDGQITEYAESVVYRDKDDSTFGISFSVEFIFITIASHEGATVNPEGYRQIIALWLLSAARHWDRDNLHCMWVAILIKLLWCNPHRRISEPGCMDLLWGTHGCLVQKTFATLTPFHGFTDCGSFPTQVADWRRCIRYPHRLHGLTVLWTGRPEYLLHQLFNTGFWAYVALKHIIEKIIIMNFSIVVILNVN